MCKKFIIILILLMLSSTAIYAQTMQSQVALSDDYSYRDKWYNITGESVPFIRDVSEIYRHQKFFIIHMLGGFKVDKANIPHVSYSVKALTPNGDSIFSYDSINAISYEVPNQNMFLLSNTELGMSFNNKDLLGVYTITGIITDNITKQKINFEKKLN